MRPARIDRPSAGVRAAIDQGLLPADATLPAQDSRPWPVVLLTGLGAWLAAVPLLGVVSLLLRDLLLRGPGPYLCGLLVLAAAVVVLRSRELPVFLEQLAVPGLLVGGGSLAFGLSRDLSGQAAAGLLAVVALGVAAAIRQAWLRALLGAVAAALALAALAQGHWLRGAERALLSMWLSLHVVLAAWLLAMVAQRRLLGQGARAPWAAALESIAAGWVLMLLASLALWSGMSFMVAGSLGPWGGLARDLGSGLAPQAGPRWIQPGSAVVAGLAALLVARAWPSLRQPLVGAVAVVLAALAWFLPALGATLLVLAWTATSQRWRLAGAAALAAAWILGSFYYQLQWPLAHKALVLLLAAVVLGTLAWLSLRRGAEPRPANPGSPARGGPTVALIALSALATLAAVNLAIRDKEALIASGDKVFVELAPIDPRSLMQGDYMRLNFRLPGDPGPLLAAQRPHVVAQREANGVARLQRIAQAADPLQPGEMRIELTPKDGRWTLVTDAWFFREGDARRWEAAKYGEFRVTPDGKALLVGLADARLQAIRGAP